MNETGFHIGYNQRHWVVSLYKVSSIQLHDSENRKYISNAECINAVSNSILSMLIFPGKQVLHSWVQKNDLDDEIVFCTSDFSYSNDEIALHWIKHFEQHSKKYQISAWRLLIVDEYGSHLTIEFLDFATTHNIVLFRLPSHSMHLMQPLDVGLF